MTEPYWYPSVDDILDIHEEIVSTSPETSAGIQNRGDIDFALEYIRSQPFDDEWESIHERAYHLLRLLVATHPFVDGNKRTALNTTAVFYRLNGVRFRYDREIRTILRQFATDESAVDAESVRAYLRTRTAVVNEDPPLEEWRDELVRYGLDNLRDDPTDPND